MIWQKYVPSVLAELYEIHDCKHAAAILANEFPDEAREIFDALEGFRFSVEEVKQRGGNESLIPKKFSKVLRPLGWREDTLTAKMIIDGQEVIHDTHKVDYLKGRVAVDLEWNSKDQTFDRDLYAFRTFFDYDKIILGVLITRSNDLDPWFLSLGQYTDAAGKVRFYKAKYGASTTHMGKLIPRLVAGRNGGCPVLVFGIATKLLEAGHDNQRID